MLTRSKRTIRPRPGRRAALARWQGRVSAVSHTRPNHSALELFFCDFSAARPRFVARLARSDSPQSRGPCPRADPPSPRPSRNANEVARSRLHGLPHAPYVFARTPVPIYCHLLLLLGLLPYLLPSNRLIILYSYHYTYHVLLLRGAILIRTHHTHKKLYITLFLLIMFGPYYYVPP